MSTNSEFTLLFLNSTLKVYVNTSMVSECTRGILFEDCSEVNVIKQFRCKAQSVIK